MSTLLWPAPLFIDGDFTVATPVSLPVFSSPLPNDTAQLIFKQDFMQLLVNVTPLALNTPYCTTGFIPDLSGYYLIAEGEKQDMGGGVVKWTRTYSAVPASYDDWEPYSYTFIGSGPLGAIATAQQVGRMRFSEKVTCRVQNDFFKLGVAVTDPITGASVTPTTPGAIPQIFALAYCSQFVLSSVQYGGYFYRQDYVSDTLVNTNVGWLTVSTPTATEYASMISDANANGWASGKSFQVISGDPALVSISSINTAGHTYYKGQIVAENSTLERWQRTGSIWIRKTRYVLAA